MCTHAAAATRYSRAHAEIVAGADSSGRCLCRGVNDDTAVGLSRVFLFLESFAREHIISSVFIAVTLPLLRAVFDTPYYVILCTITYLYYVVFCESLVGPDCRERRSVNQIHPPSPSVWNDFGFSVAYKQPRRSIMLPNIVFSFGNVVVVL